MWGLFVIPLTYAIVVMFKATEPLLLLVIPLAYASVMLFKITELLCFFAMPFTFTTLLLLLLVTIAVTSRRFYDERMNLIVSLLRSCIPFSAWVGGPFHWLPWRSRGSMSTTSCSWSFAA